MKFLRPIATPLVFFSSLVVVGTGLWMYFLTKGKLLEELHGQIGLLFFIAMILHVLVNQIPLLRQLASPKTYVSALAVALFAAGVILLKGNPPNRGGVPPAMILKKLEDARIDDLSRVFNVDQQFVIASMKDDGFSVDDSSETLSKIAKTSETEPRNLLKYFILRRTK